MTQRSAGMVAMVDAIFCMIAILVIMIVVIPRDPGKIGFLPQADAVLICRGEGQRDMVVVASRPNQDPVEISLGRRGTERVDNLRTALTKTLSDYRDTIAHVRLVAAGARFMRCHDAFLCAFTGVGACTIPKIEPWRPEGHFVSFTLTYAEEVSDG